MKIFLIIALSVSSMAFSSVTMGNGGTYTVDHLGAVKKVNLHADSLKVKRSTSFELIRKLDK